MEDVLSQVIGELRQESCAFCQLEAAEPWRIVKPQSSVAPFYAVLSGRIHIATTLRGYDLGAGDFLVLPRGEAHEIMGMTSRRSSAISLLSLFKENGIPAWQPGTRYRAVKIKHGGRGETSVAVVGLFFFGAPRTHPLLTALPPVMTLSATSHPSEHWQLAIFSAIAAEFEGNQPGASMTIAKHADLLFAHTLRTYLSQEIENPESWLGGISDPVVGTALAAMHASPERHWTLRSLAQLAGCSRAAFAKRFAELMHQGALSYLTAWRMTLAAGYLREGSYTRAEIAGRIGYRTDAFAAAFKRWSGSSPTTFAKKKGVEIKWS